MRLRQQRVIYIRIIRENEDILIEIPTLVWMESIDNPEGRLCCVHLVSDVNKNIEGDTQCRSGQTAYKIITTHYTGMYVYVYMQHCGHIIATRDTGRHNIQPRAYCNLQRLKTTKL